MQIDKLWNCKKIRKSLLTVINIASPIKATSGDKKNECH